VILLFVTGYIKRTDFILNKFLSKYYLPYSLMCAVSHITFPAGPSNTKQAPRFFSQELAKFICTIHSHIKTELSKFVMKMKSSSIKNE
jgi:hypothetical protein